MTDTMQPGAADDSLPPWQIADGCRITLVRPCVMGILNVTPDSFSDGGLHATTEQAVAAALRMIHEGARIIDVGGESTRPGSQAVSETEQLRRTIPVIESLRQTDAGRYAAISIDTTRAAVAKAALEAGAHIINDVSAGTDDSKMFALAADAKCGLILMHRLRPPSEDAYSTSYQDEPVYHGNVYSAVCAYLEERIRCACGAGVDRCSIVIDPGLGFGKSVSQNYTLASRIGDLQRELELPALSAASRKSFLAQPPGECCPTLGSAPQDRLGGSIAMTLSHWQAGVRIFRVHDVAAHSQGLGVAAAIEREQTTQQDC